MILASPFVEGGSRGIYCVICYCYFMIILNRPNLLRLLGFRCRYIPALSQSSSKCRQWHSIVVIVVHECLTYNCPVLSG